MCLDLTLAKRVSRDTDKHRQIPLRQRRLVLKLSEFHKISAIDARCSPSRGKVIGFSVLPTVFPAMDTLYSSTRGRSNALPGRQTCIAWKYHGESSRQENVLLVMRHPQFGTIYHKQVVKWTSHQSAYHRLKTVKDTFFQYCLQLTGWYSSRANESLATYGVL